MRLFNHFRFSTIAIISGSPKQDAYLHSITKTIKSVSKQNIDFVGVADSQARGYFKKYYASSEELDQYQFQVTRAYNTYHQYIQDSFIIPYRSYTHFKNYNLVKNLEKSNFFNDVYNNKYSAVVTVGNFSLALRIGQKLNAYAKQLGGVKPYTAFFDRQITERRVQNQQYFDFQYYNVQKNHHNMSGYVFPSFCVGYNGLYSAFQHLQQFKKDSNNDSFVSQNFSFDVSELIKKSRAKYRSANGLSQDKYIFFINAGSNKKQIQFSFKSFKNGFSTFLAKDYIRSINPEHFQILIDLPSDPKLAQITKEKLGFLPNNINTRLVQQKDRYAAMSAADFGLLHNGQVTVEAAGMQLPALVVDNRSNIHAYFNNLYNGHASPLNIATNYQGYEDLCGSLTAIPQKLASIMLKNFESPKEQIQKILSKSNTNHQLRVSQTGLQTGCKHLVEKALLSQKLSSPAPFKKWYQRKAALSI